MALITTSLKLDADVKERLNKLAGDKRRSANWLMGEAIREFVDREEQRAAFNKLTVERWEDYETTGKYISGEAMDTWMARLEAGEDVPPPEPE